MIRLAPRTSAWLAMLAILPWQQVSDTAAAGPPAAADAVHIERVVTAVRPERPNIVVVMADDLDARSLDTLFAEGLAPNIAAWTRDRGTQFVQSFVSNSLCCPSRATFLSGQYTHNHGVKRNGQGQGGIMYFDDARTIPVWLQAAGYYTGHVGKYLNRYGQDLDPHYVPPGWNDWQGLVDPYTYQVYGYLINDNGELVQYGDDAFDERPELYQTDVLAARAVEFILEAEARDDAQPFFLVVTPLAPHIESGLDPADVYDYASFWRQRIRPAPRHAGTLALAAPQLPSFNEPAGSGAKPSWTQSVPALGAVDIAELDELYRSRLESMLAVDDLVGAVGRALQATGEVERTVMFFTSDNGFLLGEHRLADKRAVYEEAIRVPLLVSGPGIPERHSIDAIVLNNDLAPTIVDLAGAAATLPLDGRSLLELFAAPVQGATRKRFLVEHWTSAQGLFAIPDYAAVRTGAAAAFDDRVYVEYYAGGEVSDTELYDLNVDPFQMTSLHLAPERAAEVLVLGSSLESLRVCAGALCRAQEDAVPATDFPAMVRREIR